MSEITEIANTGIADAGTAHTVNNTDTVDIMKHDEISIGGSASLPDALSAQVVRMVEQVRPSVVQVHSDGRGIGAGIIWRADGAVLTNFHVVAHGPRERAPIEVHLPDGRRFPATVTAYNPTLDLALLKLDAHDLPAAPVGDSRSLRVGELVFAVGHPWGERHMVTAGIVSGVGEVAVPGTQRTAQYVRSDVYVAPGNSGGPLLNAQGAVVGITAMIFGGDMAVAIPAHVAAEWVAGQPDRRIYLGVGLQTVELPFLSPHTGRQERAAGLMVVAVEPDAPAHRAGVMVGDVLLTLEGEPVPDPDALRRALARAVRAEGREALRLQVLRAGGVRTLSVTLHPETQAEDPDPKPEPELEMELEQAS